MPAWGIATRAQVLSMVSPSAGNFTLTRPSDSGSLMFVTSPTTRPPQSRSSFGRITSVSVREWRPEMVKRVLKLPCP